MGFEASIASQDSKMGALDHKREIKQWRNSFLLSLLFGVPTMAVMIYYMASGKHNDPKLIIPGLSVMNLVMFCLATPVQVI